MFTSFAYTSMIHTYETLLNQCLQPHYIKLMHLEVNYLNIVPPIMVCLILLCKHKNVVQVGKPMSKNWNFHASVTSWNFRKKMTHKKHNDPYKTSIKETHERYKDTCKHT